MRPILAVLITFLLIGGVFAYIRFAESVRRPPIEIRIDYAQGAYTLEIGRTFECVPDPIFSPESIKVLLKGQTLFESTDSIPANELIEVREIDGVEVGENEIYVTANRDENATGLGVIKLTLHRNEIPIAETVLSSEPGLSTVGGPFVFVVKPQSKVTDEHQH